MKNYADLGGCYPPQPSASADNTLLDLHNSSYHTQPHPIIANYQMLICFIIIVELFVSQKTFVMRHAKVYCNFVRLLSI